MAAMVEVELWMTTYEVWEAIAEEMCARVSGLRNVPGIHWDRFWDSIHSAARSRMFMYSSNSSGFVYKQIEGGRGRRKEGDELDSTLAGGGVCGFARECGSTG